MSTVDAKWSNQHASRASGYCADHISIAPRDQLRALGSRPFSLVVLVDPKEPEKPMTIFRVYCTPRLGECLPLSISILNYPGIMTQYALNEGDANHLLPVNNGDQHLEEAKVEGVKRRVLRLVETRLSENKDALDGLGGETDVQSFIKGLKTPRCHQGEPFLVFSAEVVEHAICVARRYPLNVTKEEWDGRIFLDQQTHGPQFTQHGVFTRLFPESKNDSGQPVNAHWSPCISADYTREKKNILLENK